MHRIAERCQLTFLVLIAAAAVGQTTPARADSLYRRGGRTLVSDRSARAVGDLLTVVIVETTTATQQAQSARAAQSSASAGVDLRTIPNFPADLNWFPFSGYSNAEKSDGSGSTSRTARLLSTITCRVVDVTPQGNLIIEGTRSLKMNRDTQILLLTGVVRADDVTRGNSVLSSAVADMDIRLIGKGPINVQQKPGVFSRIFRFLF